MNKKAQMMVWVIAAIFLVVAVAVFFYMQFSNIEIKEKEFSPASIIEQCISERIDEVSNKIMLGGGFVDRKNGVMFQGDKVEYLCENRGNYYPCINQHPMLLREIEKEIINQTWKDIDNCYGKMKEEGEKKGMKINLGKQEVNVSLGVDKIYFDLIRKIDIEDGNSRKSFEKFKIEIINSIYNLAVIAMEIASQEAKYCGFSSDGYSILYPRFRVEVFRLDDGTKIYSIKDKNTGREMRTAIRGCVIPSGL